MVSWVRYQIPAAGIRKNIGSEYGAVGTAILDIVLLDEPANAARLLSLALIIAGIVGLKLATPA